MKLSNTNNNVNVFQPGMALLKISFTNRPGQGFTRFKIIRIDPDVFEMLFSGRAGHLFCW